MIEARKTHTCGLVEAGAGAKKIVVVGGGVAFATDSVEIFDISAKKWRNGKKILLSLK